MATPAASGSPTAPAPTAPPHWPLPTTCAGYRLVASDYEAAATELGVETAAIHAVSTVESGGRAGFDLKTRPVLRFENHVFRRLTKGAFDKTQPSLSCAYGSAEYKLTHRYAGLQYADEQWDLLEAAFKVAPDEAVMACSWGMFQVMGENYKSVGWSDLHQFVEDMNYSEAQHLRAFLGYCKYAGLVDDLKTHDWAAFALGYNGPASADNDYSGRLASAYALYAPPGHTRTARARHA